jgi:hypothetical protein
VNNGPGSAPVQQTVKFHNSSLASQAVGPPADEFHCVVSWGESRIVVISIRGMVSFMLDQRANDHVPDCARSLFIHNLKHLRAGPPVFEPTLCFHAVIFRLSS